MKAQSLQGLFMPSLPVRFVRLVALCLGLVLLLVVLPGMRVFGYHRDRVIAVVLFAACVLFAWGIDARGPRH